jgi:hypothetical protein
MLSALAVAAVLALSVFCGAVERTINSWLPSPIPAQQMAGEIANGTFEPSPKEQSESPGLMDGKDSQPAGFSNSSEEVRPTSTYSPHTSLKESGYQESGLKLSDQAMKNTFGLGRISKSYAVPEAERSAMPENMPQN